jgi:beta-phosphoglucomutase-like phosphatase (HAD superfamily)
MGSPAAACAVIEDTPSGVAAAVAAAMRVLGLAADSDPAALRAAGAEIVASLAEVPLALGLA